MSDPVSKLKASLETDGVIPDVIPASHDLSLSVHFSVVWQEEKLEIVTAGDKVDREKTLKEPELRLTKTNSEEVGGDVKYTLVMTDPDAPSREDPKFGEWRHWVVSGVQLSANGLFQKPETSETPYYPPAPPHGSGYHRYVFLLFQEPAGGVKIREDAVERKGEFEFRAKWKASDFAQEYGLKLVGVNYFLTKRD